MKAGTKHERAGVSDSSPIRSLAVPNQSLTLKTTKIYHNRRLFPFYSPLEPEKQRLGNSFLAFAPRHRHVWSRRKIGYGYPLLTVQSGATI
ncbi:hypothetical protein HGO34_11885 [Agrobacterium vitis]|uniref:Uncharacterized protein n=1 Tax=Agrobacterium vitis TaxID=373 RepID=A0AAE5AW54_AGRVI|nr:hypothetical protein [Agrobacterium vitis]MCF1498286.1 hypothetical protein [Allorhizobium sp. Av2]MCM2440413.1 hypothetical protein [Agrobacterium vitis]MUZ58209.1 hypothetical protein [Agrobacterium vitis]MVA66171.1 hypothetical protein [Agrobacterium vitis]MVA87089.1 hypothetical protein [Agrobacterium vitis]